MNNLLNLAVSTLIGYIFGTLGIGILINIVLHLMEPRKLDWWYIQRNILFSLIAALLIGVPLAKRDHDAKIEIVEQTVQLGSGAVLNSLNMSGDYTFIYVGVIFGTCLGVAFVLPKITREQIKARLATLLGSN